MAFVLYPREFSEPQSHFRTRAVSNQSSFYYGFNSDQGFEEIAFYQDLGH